MKKNSHRRCRCGRKNSIFFENMRILQLRFTTANRLINFFGSFHAIFEASPEELCQVDGMSPSAATLIASLLSTYRLYAMDKYARLPHFKVYSDLAAYCRNLFNELYVALTGDQCALTNIRIIKKD